MTVQPGTLLAGKYRIERLLGEGGMGMVVAARHEQLGQRVAMKFLLPSACERPDIVARFLREARAAVQIKSEHVARVIDVGTLEAGEPYIVMEYLEGIDLAETIRTRGALEVSEAIDFVLQACEAIAEAHSLGIVHRDLKPANLFVTRRADGSPLVKVLDFGISKILTKADSNAVGSDLTRTAAVMGSPMYMSPEQVRDSKNVDVRTDVWSLGVILHELLVGQAPFLAETMAGLLALIVADPPQRLRDTRPSAPPKLEAVVLKCLEKDPARRYQNVAELAIALAPFAGKSASISVERISRLLLGQGDARPTTEPSSSVASPHAAVTAATWGQTQPDRRRGASRVFLAAVAGVLLLGGVVTLVAFRRTAAGAAPTATGPDPEPPTPAASVSATELARPELPASASLTATPFVPFEPVSPAKVAAKPTSKPRNAASAAAASEPPPVAPSTPKPASSNTALQGRK